MIERLIDQADEEDFHESSKTSLKTLQKTNMPLVQ
jgi:hypothetical protein